MLRLASLGFSAFFAFWSVVFPVSVFAATFSAASNLTGRAWYVPGVGSPLAGSQVLAAAATVAGRANPWIAALGIGSMISQLILEGKAGNKVGVMAKDALTPTTPPGWTDSNTPPATAGSTGTQTQAATSNPNVPRWRGNRRNSSSGNETFNYYEGASAAEIGPAMCSYAASTVNPSQTATFIGFNSSYNRADCTFSGWGYATGGGMAQYCPAGTPSGNQGSLSCSGSTLSCPSGWNLAGSTCSQVGCPVGYSPGSGNTCQLSNSANVKWPNNFEDIWHAIASAQGGLEAHPRESSPTPSTPTLQDLQAPSVFSDPYGNPVQQSVTPQPVGTTAGGYTFSQSVQTTNNNQTYTTNNTYTTNSSGVVTNVSTSTVAGPITNPSTTPAQPLPDDYNREATQKKILTGEDAAVVPNFATDVTTAKTTADTAITDGINGIPNSYASDKGRFFSWVWTPPVGLCSPITGTVSGHSISWNLCPYVGNIRDVLGWLMAVFGAWSVYNNLFKRDET